MNVLLARNKLSVNNSYRRVNSQLAPGVGGGALLNQGDKLR